MQERNKVVVFDVDGTLANIDARREILTANPDKLDWKSFNLARNMEMDLPNERVIELAKLYDTLYDIVVVSGRMENQRQVTQEWLDRYEVPHEALFLRADGDYRTDNLVKKDIMDKLVEAGYEIHLSVDDRQQVVDMWRENGIVCFQVAPGDF
jgi:HAD superfamily, subfamily IIIB (Acid phosphatase).